MTLPAKNQAPAQQIINDAEIQELLLKTRPDDTVKTSEIIEKSREMKGLSLSDVSTLLAIDDPDLLSQLFEVAREVKEEIYGKRLVLFAPLYISNFCSNACSYCAFNSESKNIKRRALDQAEISAGSRTDPGGYCETDVNAEPQFQLGDHRPLDEVIRDVMQQGYIPSFCTECYRRGRTGQDFMDLAKPGLIKHYCLPNALFTLKEYLEDYASKETKAVGEQLIKTQLSDIPSEKRRVETETLLCDIESDKRDIYF